MLLYVVDLGVNFILLRQVQSFLEQLVVVSILSTLMNMMSCTAVLEYFGRINTHTAVVSEINKAKNPLFIQESKETWKVSEQMVVEFRSMNEYTTDNIRIRTLSHWHTQ